MYAVHFEMRHEMGFYLSHWLADQNRRMKIVRPNHTSTLVFDNFASLVRDCLCHSNMRIGKIRLGGRHGNGKHTYITTISLESESHTCITCNIIQSPNISSPNEWFDTFELTATHSLFRTRRASRLSHSKKRTFEPNRRRPITDYL